MLSSEEENTNLPILEGVLAHGVPVRIHPDRVRLGLLVPEVCHSWHQVKVQPHRLLVTIVNLGEIENI